MMGMDFFEFILFEVYIVSWICKFVFVTIFGKFSAIIFFKDSFGSTFFVVCILDGSHLV